MCHFVPVVPLGVLVIGTLYPIYSLLIRIIRTIGTRHSELDFQCSTLVYLFH